MKKWIGLRRATESGSLEKAREALKDIKGLKLPLEREVTIEFDSR